MKLHLRSIEHGPVALPIWQSILEDLANPPPARVARVLGVSERTVYRWSANGHAPRVAQLALFWLTRWGQSLANANAERDCMEAVGLARTLGDQVQRLEVEVRRLRIGLAAVPTTDPGSPGGGAPYVSGATVYHSGQRSDGPDAPDVDAGLVGVELGRFLAPSIPGGRSGTPVDPQASHGGREASDGVTGERQLASRPGGRSPHAARGRGPTGAPAPATVKGVERGTS